MISLVRWLMLTLLLFAVLVVTSCQDDPLGPSDKRYFAEDTFSFEIELEEQNVFYLVGINGDVEIMGDPLGTSITVSGVRHVESTSTQDAEKHLANISVQKAKTDTAVRVWTEHPEMSGSRTYRVNYTVTLPNLLKVDARNSNGSVTVRAVSSRVTVNNSNGRITADDIVGSTSATLGSGSIDASVTLPPDGFIDMTVNNGDINLEIPQNSSAQLSATVANGTITVSGLEIRDEVSTPSSLTGTLGDGQGTISLELSNGKIEIKGVPAVDQSFRFPLEQYMVMQNFANVNPYFDGKYHAAEDAFGDAGTPVYAIADGVISYSGPMGGYGWLITVDHPASNVYSLYGHLSTRRNKMERGEVKIGDVIAYLADDDEDGSGGAYPDWGPHLHFGIRQGSRFDYPGSDDARWMAGYTYAHPTALGWMNPTLFMLSHSQKTPSQVGDLR